MNMNITFVIDCDTFALIEEPIYHLVGHIILVAAKTLV